MNKLYTLWQSVERYGIRCTDIIGVGKGVVTLVLDLDCRFVVGEVDTLELLLHLLARHTIGRIAARNERNDTKLDAVVEVLTTTIDGIVDVECVVAICWQSGHNHRVNIVVIVIRVGNLATLRIEDTDQNRFVEGATEVIYKTIDESDFVIAFVTNITKELAALKQQLKEQYATHAASNDKLHQLIDIAMLAAGQLKGEALAKFVNRSVELL